MEGRPLWHVPILAGVVAGIALGLIYTWLIAPVQFYDTAPDRLRADLKEEYILLICQTYAADGDWQAARERLATLGDPDIGATVLAQAERAIERGMPVSAIRYLAAVAGRLGSSSQAVARFVPTQVPTPTPPRAAAPTTPTPSPPLLPTVTPTPRPSPPPTFTPQPRPTAQLTYQLLNQQRICDADRPDPLLQVLVWDADNNGMSGVEVAVTWEGGSSHLVTGFKPELGRGYADHALEPGVSYTVDLAEGSEQVSGIQTAPCNSTAGPRQLSVRLIFVKAEPSS